MTDMEEKGFNGFKANGFVMLFTILAILIVSILGIIYGACNEDTLIIVSSIIVLIADLISIKGFIEQEPNEARVMIFFGKYKGTFRNTGFYWVNPFIDTKKLSLRARNINAEPIKVNDKIGNPVMIGLVLVWKLKDTYKAMFEIDAQTMATNTATGTGTVSSRMTAFEKFVKIQSDAALRQLASLYSYDSTKESEIGEPTLRSGGDIVNKELVTRLNERLDMAGMEVIEARINYLAYAPEIAAVMLRRQQADAIIMAREKIVEGAVSMVNMALNKLSDEKIVTLDNDKRAAMISNLLVVLCADEPAQPIINSGASK